MIATFKKDVQRWIIPEQIADPTAVTFLGTLKLMFRNMPLRAMFWFRLGSWLHQKGIPFFPGSIQRLIYRKFGLEMVISQKIGGGLYIAHPIGTVISVSEMGENCSIIAAVTIGMRNKWAFPKIGDKVFIGAGARILGDITIGDEALIGANSVVIRDVPAGATAVGIPAKLLDTSGKAERKQPGNPNETFQGSSNGVAVH